MNKWIININGRCNEVIFKPNKWSGKHKLIINGEEVLLKKAPLQGLVGVDQPIAIAGKECRFVLIGKKADIAIDGIYVDSKKPYIPLESMPWWTWVFIIACAAVPIISLGGALPVMFSLSCAAGCVKVSVMPNMSEILKVMCCFAISALDWVMLGVLLLVVM